MKPSVLPPALVRDVRTALLEHYERERRDLPWRGESDPYRVLVSEVMLQQTRVETVRRYYEPWLDRFPDLDSLAAADRDQVLKAWEGLGYYRRAANLHRAARAVRERPDGALPSTRDGLRDLPGVGEYTAGAVASIAFGEAVPAVDGNVRRVLARLFDVAAPSASWLRDAASQLVDPMRPGDWNQALMELGATVCLPRTPDCPSCPLAQWCEARAADTASSRPQPKKKPPVRTATFVLAALHFDGRVLLVRRPPDGLLADMWAFPEVVLEEEMAPARAALDLAASIGCDPTGEPVPLSPCEHRFTHLVARYLPMSVEVAGARSGERRAWLDADEASGLALPVAQRKVLDSWRQLASQVSALEAP